MAKSFIENKISGAVLMSLTENHIKEMNCAVLGQLSLLSTAAAAAAYPSYCFINHSTQLLQIFNHS